MDFLKVFTICVYILLAISWGYIFIFSLKKIFTRKYTSNLVLILIMILLFDSFRTLFESVYFGISVSTILNVLPSDIFSFFAIPENKAIPKVINLITTLIILFIFIKRWLPEEEIELQKKIKKEEEILKLNEELKSKSESLEKVKLELENLNKNLEKRVEEEIRNRVEKEELLIQQSRLAQMGEMIGNIAHQWRQPLNALGLILQKLQIRHKKNALKEENLNEAVDKGMKLINKMSTTIDDFRNFFNPNREKIHFDISDTIMKSIEILEASFKTHNIEIVFDKIEVNYFGYPTELSQVMLNILNNAKDAILENCIKNGKVTIEIKTNEKIKIHIMDNGGGVPDNIIDKIFEPYFTTKDGTKGTGIGLYMSKIIIEEHMRGKINLFNSENGAVFEIIFPKINN